MKSRTGHPMMADHPNLQPWLAIHQAIGVVQTAVRDQDWRSTLVARLQQAADIVQVAGDEHPE